MRKDGFTLVELLAVIVLLGLLMAIAVPSALTMSSKVKAKAYDTKIDLIESAAKTYGQSNLSLVRRGINSIDNRSHSCYMTYEDDKIKHSLRRLKTKLYNTRKEYLCDINSMKVKYQ